MSEITITRALSELKTLDARIEKYQDEAQLVFVEADSKISGRTETKQEVESIVKSAFQKYSDLMKRRNTIKQKIVVSNANTKVEIAGVTYTVAEAIEMKNTIKSRKNFMIRANNQLTVSIMKAEQANVQLQQRIDQQLAALYGRDKTLGEAERKAVVEPMEKQFKATVFDPCNISKFIEEEDKSISDFMLEVDVALSEINAITKIDV